MSLRSSSSLRLLIRLAVLLVSFGVVASAIAEKPQRRNDARMRFGDVPGDGISSDGLGEYVDGGRTVVGMNPNDGSIHVNSGSNRTYCFDFSQCASESCESPFGTDLTACLSNSRISIWSAGLNMLPGETKAVGIRVNFETADGRDWWLHFNHPRWISDGSPNDPNPPTVTAYDLDGSGDGVSDTWVTQATANTTPAVLYELIKIKGQDTKIERGRFIMPFTLTLILDR